MTPYKPQHKRKILCVSPRLSHSMATMDNAFPLMGVKAFSPVQGLLVVAAYLPADWEVRFVDESLGPVSDTDLSWADAVFITGMHIQRSSVDLIASRAQKCGKIAILGGPSVSGCPEYYPTVDILHVGELGDATDQIIVRLDKDISRPASQERYTTQTRLPLQQFPVPAYHLVTMTDYMMGTVQFSSGCPYRCEFCDIPELYGRNPRTKTPEQICIELDAILARGNPGAVYIVDDNFIGNRKAAIELLKELVKWQEARGFPIIFGFEATLNLAQVPELLELMKAAAFQIVFCGVETPEIGALKEIHKDQNLRVPILEAIQTLNRYGLYVVSGIIFGFDTDTPDTRDNVLKFIKASNVPFLTINVLTALPRTPLWRRLETANRLVDATNRESNIEFLLPYDQVVEAWRSCVVAAYEPGALLDRFDYQLDHVFPNRRKLPASPARTSWSMMSRGLKIFARIFWVIGGKMPYRRRFWQTAFKAIRQGQLEELVTVAITAYHLIIFGQEAGKGQIRAGLYNPNPEEVAA